MPIYNVVGGQVNITGRPVYSIAPLIVNDLNIKHAAYGAKGDNVCIYDAVTTASSATVTSVDGFNGATAGMSVTIRGAGTSGRDHTTTIASVGGLHSITLTAAPATSVNPAYLQYGTDDTLKIRQILLDAATAGGRNIIFPDGQFVVAGGLQQLDNRGNNPNAQIALPSCGNTDHTRWHTRIRGALPPSSVTLGLGADILRPQGGTWIVSYIDGSGTNPSVFGGASANSAQYTFENIQIATRSNPGGIGVALSGILGLETASCSSINCLVVADSSLYAQPMPQSACVGITGNRKEMEAMSRIQDCAVWGYNTGYLLQEHVVADNIMAAGCYIGFMAGASGQTWVGYKLNSHWNKYAFIVQNGTRFGLGAGGQQFVVDMMNVEDRNGTYNQTWYERVEDYNCTSVSGVKAFMRINVSSSNLSPTPITSHGSESLIVDILGNAV